MSFKFRKASEFVPKPPDFVWPGRIPYGAVTILDGDPGTNKSTLVADIAARLTTGRPMWNCDLPAGKPPKPEAVMVITSEDDEGTTQSRLRAAGANLELVHLYDTQASNDTDGLLFPRDGQELTNEVLRQRIQLVVIDPLSEFADRSLQNDGSARKVMGCLGRIASRTSAAVLVVRHLTKSGGGNPLHRGLGSVAVGAVARSCLRLIVDPADPCCRILVHVKCSFGKRARSVCFKLIERQESVAVDYAGYRDLGVDDLDAYASRSSPQLDEAMKIIFRLLATGRLPANDCLSALRKAGISPSTSHRAKKTMGVQSKGEGFGKNHVWYWELPTDSPVVDRLRQAETAELADRLFNGDDYLDDESDEGDIPAE